MNKNKFKKKNGITLIALVITIIVMLILVAVTISMAINGGLFGYAGKATGDTKNAVNAEQELASGRVQIDGVWYDSIDDYLVGKESTNQGNGTTEEDNGTYDETAKDENGLLTANATYISGEYTAIIPKGFAIVPGIDGTTTIADGLVITDKLDEEGNSIGNEFVWIPVVLEGETQTEKEAAFEKIRTDGHENNGTLQTLVSAGSVIEPYANGYDEEETDYSEMKTSVIENGGFYIGRYEAGSTTPRAYYNADDETITDDKRTTPIVVKRDVYPYVYVGWGASLTDYTSSVIYTSQDTDFDQGKGALYLSKALYADCNVGVKSTLCYGIMWDAMLNFIEDDEHSISSSTSWGNHLDSGFTIRRATAKYALNYDNTWNSIEDGELDKTANSTKLILTTGADDSFATKNIFDVAGNAEEWTNEVYSSNYRILRGGEYTSPGWALPASRRKYNMEVCYCSPWHSFRCVLYVV